MRLLMVDYFSLAVSHGVLILAFWRLLWRDDLNADPQPGDDGENREGQANRA